MNDGDAPALHPPGGWFTGLRAETPHLTGAQRMRVFFELPRSIQLLAWKELAEWCADRSQHAFENGL